MTHCHNLYLQDEIYNILIEFVTSPNMKRKVNLPNVLKNGLFLLIMPIITLYASFCRRG